MTKTAFLKTLARLDLLPASKITANALGVSVRNLQRMGAGDIDVPAPIERLLAMYLEHGIPKHLTEMPD